MKIKKVIFIIICFLMSFTSVSAMRPDEIKARDTDCEKFELADAKEDGSLEKVACYDTYEDAKKAMDESENDNLVILENKVIIDVKYGVIDYEVDLSNTREGIIYVYNDKNSTETNGHYIKGGQPDDAAFIEFDYKTKRIKIMISGLVGWIDQYDGSTKLYDMVPLSWATDPQSYIVIGGNDDKLVHNFPKNVYNDPNKSAPYQLAIGKKPTMLDPGVYYSYDGHYFYKDMKQMLKDYKNNTYENAVNHDKPFYNYYQYLSFRTRTNYTKENIDAYNKERLNKTSLLQNTGEFFIDTQDKYGVNAILMWAIGMNESAQGTSNIAKATNNLFGLNAVDKTPGQSASYFPSIEDCIRTYGSVWLSYRYLQPGDTRYKGANVGNKTEGLNYRYASDPFWGEKAAAFYYQFDKKYDFQDYNAYQLAVLNSNEVIYALKTPGGDKVFHNYYQYNIKDSVVVIYGEVEGPSINGNKIWYKVASDPAIRKDFNYTESASEEYSWDTFVYVPAAYFTKINEATGNIPDFPTKKEDEVKPTPPEEKPTAPTAKKISSIVTEAKYKYSKGIISGIKPKTDVSTVIKNLTNAGGTVTVTSANGKKITKGKIGTGMKVNITSGTTENLTVLIYGDVDGDGEISAVDYVKIKNSIMGTNTITGVYKTAADVNKDNIVDAVDYVNIKNYIMGSKNVISN